jgi:protein TonB
MYPISRLKNGESGDAVIEFTVDQQGIPRDFRVVSSDYPYYASHAILAVQKWRFQPALKAGRPVSARVRVPFHYQSR